MGTSVLSSDVETLKTRPNRISTHLQITLLWVNAPHYFDPTVKPIAFRVRKEARHEVHLHHRIRLECFARQCRP